MSRRSSHCLSLLALVLVVNVSVSQAMLPPPMLRAVCGAFADAEEAVGNSAMAAGKAAVDLAMKPIAIVGGLKTAAVGAGMKVSGGAIKFVGEKMAKDGAFLESTGAGVKGAGLGVAALGLKPMAEKVVSAGQAAEGTLAKAQLSAQEFAHKIGDTSVQIDARLDSPILGHHSKHVEATAGLETAFSQHHEAGDVKNDLVQQASQQVEQQTTKTKRSNKIDPEVMKASLSLVKDAKLEDCVARAICDLNCNPQGFGSDGKAVFMNMVRLQGSNAIDASDMTFFKEAASKGRSNSGKCDQCSQIYSKCNSKSSDLIKMASHIKMDN